MATRRRGDVGFTLHRLEVAALAVAVRRGVQLVEANFRLEGLDVDPHVGEIRAALAALEVAPIAMDSADVNLSADAGVQLLLAAEMGLRAIEALSLIQSLGTMERAVSKVRAAV